MPKQDRPRFVAAALTEKLLRSREAIRREISEHEAALARLQGELDAAANVAVTAREKLDEIMADPKRLKLITWIIHNQYHKNGDERTGGWAQKHASKELYDLGLTLEDIRASAGWIIERLNEMKVEIW